MAKIPNIGLWSKIPESKEEEKKSVKDPYDLNLRIKDVVFSNPNGTIPADSGTTCQRTFQLTCGSCDPDTWSGCE